MKNLLPTLSRLAVVLTGALALGSCSRAEYAFLPKSASYLGTTTAAPKARAAAPTPTPVAQMPAAVAPEITVATPPVVSVPVAAPAAAPTPPAPAEAVAPAATPPKLNLVQRLAVNKMMRKLEKQTQKITARRGDNTASTTRSNLDSKLRYAIIFGAIGLILLLFPGSLIHTVATILFIIALLFLLFWLLDNL